MRNSKISQKFISLMNRFIYSIVKCLKQQNIGFVIYLEFSQTLQKHTKIKNKLFI